MKKQSFSKRIRKCVSVLCAGSLLFGMGIFAPMNASAQKNEPYAKQKTSTAEYESYTPKNEGRETQSPNFFTTWMMQYTSDNAPSAYDRVNDENLFGEEGWARTLYPEARRDLYFVLDVGWDLPDSRRCEGIPEDYYGTDQLDPGKFPYEGDAAQRLKTLNDKIKALGWKGTGLWIWSQEPADQYKPTDGKPWNEDFWRARLEESKEAGIALWKIDYGEYMHNSEWQRFLTELAREVYPELLIERAIGGAGDANGREPLSFSDEAAYMLSYSDLYKTYDVSDHLHTAQNLERIGSVLLASYMEDTNAGGWIDSHDVPYASASLGTTIETLRANRYEVARLVRWENDYAPAFAAGAYETKLSNEYFADDWTYLNGHEDWTGNSLGNVVQRAPSVIARGIDLPSASVDSGDRPFLTASRNPSGAVSIATHPRTHNRTLDQVIYADVNFPIGDLTGPVGVFGYYRTLTMTFSTSIEGKRIYAKDILSEELMDITAQVTVSGNCLTVPGELIERIGTGGVTGEDTGAPGMYLQIGEGDDYLPAPPVRDRVPVWQIPNSSFETFSYDINGADYDPLAAKPQPRNFSITDLSAFELTQDGHTGDYAASHTADRAFDVMTSSKKYVLPKGFYTASLWVKTAGLSEDAAATLSAVDSGQVLASFDIAALAKSQDISEWTKITVPDFFVSGAVALEIRTKGSAGDRLLFDDLSLTPVSLESKDALIANIRVDGEPVQNYRSDVAEYTVPILITQQTVPVVTAESRSDAEVTVTQATSVPGTAKVTAVCGAERVEYTIHFAKKNYEYVSDQQFLNAVSSWGTPTRDLSVQGAKLSLAMENGETETFEKGIGVNADAEVTVNISGKNYSLFESYVGVQTGTPSVASVEFKVLADGKLIYSSGRMTASTPAKFVSVNIEGASEITLIADSLDTIDYDVADWANACFRMAGEIPMTELLPEHTAEGETTYDISLLSASDFSATLTAPESGTAVYRILGDGELLSEQTVSAGGADVPVSLTVKGYSELTVLTEGTASLRDAKLIIGTAAMNKLISGVYADGEPISDFILSRADYNVFTDGVTPPVLTVDHSPEAEVTVTQAQTLPGTAYISASYGKLSWECAVRFLPQTEELCVSDMEWSGANAAYGTVNRDETVDAAPLKLLVDGAVQTFSKGVGFNADAQLELNISNLGFKSFTALAGVDPDAGARGTVNFKVFVDGYCVAETGTLDGTMNAVPISVDVENASKVTLIADSVDDIVWDHGAWANAAFSYENADFSPWVNPGGWFLSHQDGLSAVAPGTKLDELRCSEPLTDDINISYDVSFMSTGDIPDDNRFEFTNPDTGIRIGGRVKGVHNEVMLELLYQLPGEDYKTLYMSPKWLSSGKNVHIHISCAPGEALLTVQVSNESGILIDKTASFPGVTAENFFQTGSGVLFSFHNDNTSRYRLSNILLASEEQTVPHGMLPGDVNFDGQIDVFDIHMLLAAFSGETTLSPLTEKAGDVNFDGKTDRDDMLRIERHILGLEPLREMMPFCLDRAAATMYVGDQLILRSFNAAGNITWSSDNESVATVSGGVVTAVGTGTAVITAGDGSFSDSCRITVIKPILDPSAEWTMPRGWKNASTDSVMAISGSGSLESNAYKTTVGADKNIHIAFDVTPDPNNTESSFFFTLKAPSQSAFLRVEFQWVEQAPSHSSNANVVLNRGADYGYAWQLIHGTGWNWTGSTYHIEVDWNAATEELTLTRTGDPSDTVPMTVTCAVPCAAGTAGVNFFESCGSEQLTLEVGTWVGGFTLSNFEMTAKTLEELGAERYWSMPEGWEDVSADGVTAISGSGSIATNAYKTTVGADKNIHIAFDVTPDSSNTESSFFFTLKAPSQSSFLRVEFQWVEQAPSHSSNANVVLNRGADYGYAWQLIHGTGWNWTGGTYHIEVDWDAAAEVLTLSRTGDPSDTVPMTVTCAVPCAAGTAGVNFFESCGSEQLTLEVGTWVGGFTLSNFEMRASEKESGEEPPQETTGWSMPIGWQDMSTDDGTAFYGSGDLTPNVYSSGIKGTDSFHIGFDVTPDPEITDSSFFITLQSPSQSSYLRIEFLWGVQPPSHLSNANVVMMKGAEFGYGWEVLGSTGLSWTGSTFSVDIDWDAEAELLTVTRSGDPADTQTASITCAVPAPGSTAGESFFAVCGAEDLELAVNTWTGGFTMSDFEMTKTSRSASGKRSVTPTNGLALDVSVSEEALLPGEEAEISVCFAENCDPTLLADIVALQLDVSWDPVRLDFVADSDETAAVSAGAHSHLNTAYDAGNKKAVLLFYDEDRLSLPEIDGDLLRFKVRGRNTVLTQEATIGVTLKAVLRDGSTRTVSLADVQSIIEGPCINGHSYVDGVCEYCGTVDTEEHPVKIGSAYLRIDENINVIYTAEVPADCTDPYMVFTFHGRSIKVTDYIQKDGKLLFELSKVVPQCMGDNISATLYAKKNGATVSNTVAEYSVKQYCENQLERYADDAKLVTLLSDLLTYGAAAQTYTGYKTDALVTEGLSLTPSTFTALDAKKATFSGEKSEAADWNSAALVLANDLGLRLTFKAASVDGLSVDVTINGRTQTYTDFTDLGGGKYAIIFYGIKATEFDDAVTAIFKLNGESIGRTVSYSVNTYISGTQACGNANLEALVKALYNYGTSAKAYAD